MGVTLTPHVTVAGVVISWLCRSGPEHRRYGDRYTTSCLISRTPGGIALAEGLTAHDLGKAEVDELKALLRAEGSTALHFERIRPDGVTHRAVVNLRRPDGANIHSD